MVSGLKNDSRVKKKQKIVFAKDKKQAVIAMLVIFVFLGNSVRMIVEHYQKEAREKALLAQAAKTPMDQTIAGMDAMNAPIADPAEQAQPSKEEIKQDMDKTANDIYMETVKIKNREKSLLKSQEDVAITPKDLKLNRNIKRVSIVVANSGRTNPFLPESESLPASLAYLTSPPQTVPENSEAGEVMSTTISGILFDKYSPSAIINISGADYLVKKGDIINGYKILAIEKNLVLVKLGNNTYKAGVGELLAKTGLNYNTIANLNKKFGGNNVTINVKKKGY